MHILNSIFLRYFNDKGDFYLDIFSFIITDSLGRRLIGSLRWILVLSLHGCLPAKTDSLPLATSPATADKTLNSY